MGRSVWTHFGCGFGQAWAPGLPSYLHNKACLFLHKVLRTDSNGSVTLELLEASHPHEGHFSRDNLSERETEAPHDFQNLVTLDGSPSRDRMDLGTCVLSGPRPLDPPNDTGRFRP